MPFSGRSHAGMRGSAGFTLVELIIVMAIIGLLVAIIVPALRLCQVQARRTVCLSNLHQIGTAAIAYAASNSGHIPRGNNSLWMVVFLQYLSQDQTAEDYRQVEIYRCPDYPNAEQVVCYVDSSWGFSGRNDNLGWEVLDPTKLSQFHRPAGTIYFADNESGPWRPIIVSRDSEGIDRCDVWHPTHLPGSNAQQDIYGRRVARSRHLEGCNVMYLDGHSDWMEAGEMTIDMWRDNWR